MCSMSRTAPRRRCAKPGTGRGPGSIRSWSRPSSASRRGLRSGTCFAPTICRGGLRARAAAQASVPIDEDYLDDIAAAFAQVVDSKSPYTSGHSERVTLFTDMIAEQLGFGAEQRRWLKRAALLHDIGKLGVSNAILDKPGKLDDAEWEIMRMHCRAFRSDPVAHRRVQRTRPDRRRASRAARRQGLSARPLGRPDLPGNPDHHHRRHLRCADRRASLSRRDAGHKSAGDHVRNGRYPDRRELFCRAHPRAWPHRRDAGRLTLVRAADYRFTVN